MARTTTGNLLRVVLMFAILVLSGQAPVTPLRGDDPASLPPHPLNKITDYRTWNAYIVHPTGRSGEVSPNVGGIRTVVWVALIVDCVRWRRLL